MFTLKDGKITEVNEFQETRPRPPTSGLDVEDLADGDLRWCRIQAPWEAVFTIRRVTTAGLALPLRVGVLALERGHLREPAAA
jgi:hypothetical protein